MRDPGDSSSWMIMSLSTETTSSWRLPLVILLLKDRLEAGSRDISDDISAICFSLQFRTGSAFGLGCRRIGGWYSYHMRSYNLCL
jgi:hypothetical protein